MERSSRCASRSRCRILSFVLAACIGFAAIAAVIAGKHEHRHYKQHENHQQHRHHHRERHHDHHDHHDHEHEGGGWRPGRYNTRAGPVEGKLNVHLVAHSHDDVGWLKTVDQYYVGSNNSIQVAAVQYILDTVVEQLSLDPNRKFIQVEQGFFQRWWRRQPKDVRRVVRRLVKNGQLEFTNGGWCMHDEAATHYADMVHQMSLGLRLIRRQFGQVPRIAWQIDPFGHSAVQGYLISALGGFHAMFFARADDQGSGEWHCDLPSNILLLPLLLEIGCNSGGFDAVFFARADYEDSEARYRERTAEFVWRGSETLKQQAEVFGGRLYVHYLPPDSFRYDTNNWDPPVQDDPELYDYNVQERVDKFVETALKQAESYRTNHIMWTMGDDFAYSNAITWFRNMDKLIHYVNRDGRVNALYSTPSIYVDAKHHANESWPLKTGDFFPYADCPHCYWTGYFSSRPAFKRYVRTCSALLLAAQQVEALVGRSRLGRGGEGAAVAGEGRESGAEELEEAMAVAQHHDSVSGTAKQHVNDDYTLRLYRGAVKASSLLTEAIRCMIYRQSEADTWQSQSPLRQMPSSQPLSSPSPATTSPLMRALGKRGAAAAAGAAGAAGAVGGGQAARSSRSLKLSFEMCPLSNISFCPPSQTDLQDGKVLVVAVYNPLAWARKEIVRFPVSTADVEVMNASGAIIPSQVLPDTLLLPTTRSFLIQAYDGPDAEPDAAAGAEPGGAGSEALSLVFWADAPPLGVASFFVLYKYPEGRTEERVKEGAEQEGGVDRRVLGDEPEAVGQDNGMHGGEEEEDEIVIGGWAEVEGREGSSSGSSALTLSFSRAQGGRMTRAVLLKREQGQGEAEGGMGARGEVPSAKAAAAAAAAAAADVSIEWAWYNASDGKASREASGAYIFRPTSPDPVPINPPNSTASSLQVVRGPLVDEVHRQVAPWIKEIVRVYKGTNYAEMEYAVGPVPVDDGFGKEVVVRLSSSLASNATFFTDSNGRDFIQRTRNFRADWNLTVTEPTAGNYYPVNSGIYLHDKATDLSVLVDRATGASSLNDGQLELMLHRRLLHDDHRGVAEALNERVCVGRRGEQQPQCMGLVVAGTLRFGLHPHTRSDGGVGSGEVEEARGEEVVEAAAEWRRGNIQRIFSPLQVAFAVENEEALAAEGGRYTWHIPGTQDSKPVGSTESMESRETRESRESVLSMQLSGKGGRVMKEESSSEEERREEEMEDEEGGGAEEDKEETEQEEQQEEEEAEEAEGGREGGVADSFEERTSKRPAYELPRSVAIITLQELHEYKVLLRLAHLYEAEEDPLLSQPALVNLDRLFAHQEIEKVTELSLMANQKLLKMRPPMKWRTEQLASKSEVHEDVNAANKEVRRMQALNSTEGPFIVELGPMEIRTFAIQFDD
ncbi:hypothetical protein CLOP_g15174 [Closterium sp. NIES-67]|nr:hypothetical protein CLOP_g15174 [Closterium sp. NIES-67]